MRQIAAGGDHKEGNVDYIVEKNITIPSQQQKSKYPYGKMEIGDSFFVPGPIKKNTIQASASNYGKRHQKKVRNTGCRWRHQGLAYCMISAGGETERRHDGIRRDRI